MSQVKSPPVTWTDDNKHGPWLQGLGRTPWIKLQLCCYYDINHILVLFCYVNNVNKTSNSMTQLEISAILPLLHHTCSHAVF